MNIGEIREYLISELEKKDNEITNLESYQTELETRLNSIIEELELIENEIDNLKVEKRGLQSLTASDLVKEYLLTQWKDYRN